MTIDDRLRDYATRWNAAAVVPPTPGHVAVPENDVDLVIAPAAASGGRRTRSTLAAAFAAVLVATGGVTAAVLVDRGGSSPAAAALREPPPYPPGTVAAATPAGELIPTSRRVAAADVGGSLLTGGSWSLSSQVGQVVVVSVWGSWCAPCQQYAPTLDALARPGVTVVGFAVQETDPNATRQFVASTNITYPVVNGDHGTVVDDLAPRLDRAGVPLTFLIDRRGGIAAVYLGSSGGSDVTSAVADLLAE